MLSKDGFAAHVLDNIFFSCMFASSERGTPTNGLCALVGGRRPLLGEIAFTLHANTSQLFIDEVLVPASNLLGGRGGARLLPALSVAVLGETPRVCLACERQIVSSSSAVEASAFISRLTQPAKPGTGDSVTKFFRLG